MPKTPVLLMSPASAESQELNFCVRLIEIDNEIVAVEVRVVPLSGGYWDDSIPIRLDWYTFHRGDRVFVASPEATGMFRDSKSSEPVGILAQKWEQVPFSFLDLNLKEDD